jgi:hypothetical protein
MTKVLVCIEDDRDGMLAPYIRTILRGANYDVMATSLSADMRIEQDWRTQNPDLLLLSRITVKYSEVLLARSFQADELLTAISQLLGP